MKILSRYVLREHAGPFIAALGVLTGLMLLNQLAKRFSDLVGKGLPWYVIGEVFGLSVPFIIAMTMPMAVLVAVLYTFARLAGDNEVTAFKAGGVSLVRLTLPLLAAASLIAGGMIWFNDRVLPESNHALRQLLTDIARKQPTFELRERVINEVVDGKLFLQAARIDRMRSVLRDLVIFDQGRASALRTIYADSGYMAFNETHTDLYLTLFDGSMHELDPQNPAMDQTTYYGKQVIRVAGVSNELQRGSGTDWRGDREMSIGMMRDQVRQRAERLAALRDSLDQIIDSLRPIRALPPASPPGDQETTAIPIPARRPDSPGREELRVPTGRGEVEEAGAADDRAQRRPVPPLTRAKTVAPAKPVTETPTKAATRQAPTKAAELQALRKRLAPAHRAGWPPRGDPAAFAAQVRSRFERLASRAELQRREMNKYEVEIQKKYAIPLAAIVFVLIGAPVAIRFPRGGIGMVIGVSLSVFCVYYIFLIGGEDVADRGIMSPFWAMWSPNVIFTVLGAFLFYLVTRGGTRRRNLYLQRIVRRIRSGGARPTAAGREAA